MNDHETNRILFRDTSDNEINLVLNDEDIEFLKDYAFLEKRLTDNSLDVIVVSP